MMMAEEWVSDMPTVLSYVKNAGEPAQREFNVVLDFIAPTVLVDAITTSGTSPSKSVHTLASHLVGGFNTGPEGRRYLRLFPEQS